LKKVDVEALREIAIKIGYAAVEASMEFLPRVAAGLQETDKAISFSVAVKTKHGKNGILECEVIPKSPSIPTPDIDPKPLVLKLDGSGQLSLLFDGSDAEMRAAAAAAEPADDGYVAGSNARTAEDAETGASAIAAADAEGAEGAAPGEPVH